MPGLLTPKPLASSLRCSSCLPWLRSNPRLIRQRRRRRAPLTEGRSLPSPVSSSRCFALTSVPSQQFCLHVNISCLPRSPGLRLVCLSCAPFTFLKSASNLPGFWEHHQVLMTVYLTALFFFGSSPLPSAPSTLLTPSTPLLPYSHLIFVLEPPFTELVLSKRLLEQRKYP